MRSAWFLAAAFCALASLPATAQTAPSTRALIRGTVERLDGQSLAVKSREGPSLTVTLTPNVGVVYLVKKSLADIKPGDYVASTGIKGTDGKIHAIEVRILPEAARGAGEGQYPWDLKPDAMMTNATVTGTATATDGRMLKVSYKGTTSEYMVGPECPVYGYAQGDTSLLKPGAAVFIVAQKKPDGTLTAARVTAEKDGIKPPM